MVEYNPEVNAGLGLVFRLNALWDKADRRALSGNLDAWELVLDRIFSNLLYREELEVIENSDGVIKEIKLQDKDIAIWNKIKSKIRFAKLQTREAVKGKKITKIHSGRNIHYNAIMFYDIWLRKFMQSLGGLYLKESESNPGRAMFGAGFKAR